MHAVILSLYRARELSSVPYHLRQPCATLPAPCPYPMPPEPSQPSQNYAQNLGAEGGISNTLPQNPVKHFLNH